MPPFIASLIGLPRWAHGLIAIAAAVAAFLVWDWLDDRAAIREHEREIAEEVERLDAIADGEARAVASGETGKIEAGNTRAREAAAKSDDRLKAGLDALR